jgi:mannose-6-phosphate isomerase
VKLESLAVEKPWGRMRLPEVFAAASCNRPIGEIWFLGGGDLPLLAKYLFTSEKLSVQVHPDDYQAQIRGFARGKAECWFVLDAEPGARIGLGLRAEASSDAVRRAALDGSVEHLIDWRPVAPGDFYFVPPGTIHAIGAGISLLELQQNSDVTYRLYDYGRPRSLHLDEGMSVAECGRYPEHLFARVDTSANTVLVDGPYFTLVHSHRDALQDRQRWILPLEGHVSVDGEVGRPGDCLLLAAHQRLDTAAGRMLIAAAPPLDACISQFRPQLKAVA